MPADDIYHRNPARDIESFAVSVVSAWVGERGVVEDTSEGAGPDFHICYSDGRSGWGEVGWHEDEQMRAMWSNTFKHDRHQQIDLPPGVGQWVVELVKGANIKRLYKELPAFLSTLTEESMHYLSIEGSWPRGEPADTARRLGVDYANLIAQGPDVAVFFMPGTGGTVPTDPDIVADWVTDVLADPDYADTTGKLVVLEADERHVFLMSGSRTSFGTGERLRRLAEGLPARAPTVPTGITHVWVISQFGDGPGGLWARDESWSWVALPKLEEHTDQTD